MARVVAASLLDCPFSRASLGNGIRLLTVGRIGDSGQLLVDVLPDNEIWSDFTFPITAFTTYKAPHVGFL